MRLDVGRRQLRYQKNDLARLSLQPWRSKLVVTEGTKIGQSPKCGEKESQSPRATLYVMGGGGHGSDSQTRKRMASRSQRLPVCVHSKHDQQIGKGSHVTFSFSPDDH